MWISKEICFNVYRMYFEFDIDENSECGFGVMFKCWS